MQKSLVDTAVNHAHVESLKKELLLKKLELNETKERAMSLSAQLKDLENQHIKTVRVFDTLLLIITPIFLRSRFEN